MVGLLITLNGRPPIAAAQVEDGVLGVIVHALRSKRPEGLVREARVEVGALLSTASGDRHVKWLYEALKPDDEIGIVVAEIDRPDPWSEEAESPQAFAECPCGIEVLLNGSVVAREVVVEEQRKTVAIAMVVWIRGAQTNPTPDEYVTLDVGLDYTHRLSVGDTVRMRML